MKKTEKILMKTVSKAFNCLSLLADKKKKVTLRLEVEFTSKDVCQGEKRIHEISFYSNYANLQNDLHLILSGFSNPYLVLITKSEIL